MRGGRVSCPSDRSRGERARHTAAKALCLSVQKEPTIGTAADTSYGASVNGQVTVDGRKGKEIYGFS